MRLINSMLNNILYVVVVTFKVGIFNYLYLDYL